MKNVFKKIELETKKQFEVVNVTEKVKQVLKESGIKDGIAVLFCPHTTAGVRLNHDEPLLIQDVMKALYRMIPVDANYSHDLFEIRQNVAANERSNGHAHVKSFIMGSSETLIIQNNELMLGGKQSLFFLEFDGGRPRELFVTIMGE